MALDVKDLLTNLLTLVGIAGGVFALVRNWQTDRRDAGKKSRSDLENDYERVRQERDGLLKRVSVLECDAWSFRQKCDFYVRLLERNDIQVPDLPDLSRPGKEQHD